MDGKITYHQQVSYCGKPRCRRCREGTGHGPYWYAYQTINGRTVRTYVGKHPPPEALQGMGMPAAGKELRETSTAASSEAAVRLYVLGQFTLERRKHSGTARHIHRLDGQWQSVTGAALRHQRVRSLLTCLISSPGRTLGREQAIELLWPDLDFGAASRRLDKAVHSLRQLFEPGRSRPATSDLLLTEHATLQLADQSRLWIDADAFEDLLAQAHASSDPGRTEQLLEEALLLYGGDYVPDEHAQAAVLVRRESLQRSWIGLLLELADLRIAREAVPAAIETLDHLLAIDPTSEAAVQRLLLLLAQSGRRAEAIRLYQRFATLLAQEYHMEPLPETRALYEAARRGSDSGIAGISSTSAPREPSSPEATGVASGSSGATPMLLDRLLTPEQETARVVEADPHAHLPIGRSHQSRLVGRERELAVLQQFLDATEQARRIKLAGQKHSIAAPEARRSPLFLLLVGEVGIGKTRLAEELGRAAAQCGWTVAWTRAYAQESSIPYRLWTDGLRKAMNQGLWQRQEIVRHPLRYEALRPLLPELDNLLPKMEAAPSSPEQEQLRLWEATRALLETVSENAPQLIVLDDLQWADNSSCELLAYLVRQLRGHPVLIAGTCRDLEVPPAHPLRAILNDLEREHALEIMTVEPLSDEHIRALVSDLPEGAVRHIQSRAAGNPFFAEELARNIQWPDLPDDLPDTISAVLDLRLGRVSPACRRMLEHAAALGGSFEFALLRALESKASAFEEDVLLDLLEEALQAGMITEEGSGTHITYQFWHPLLASHLYDGLSAGRRASLHRRAAEALRAIHAGREEEAAATIVYHLTNGGADSRDIAHYAELAGDQAYALSAYPEAARHYRLAVEHGGTLPGGAGAGEYLHLANLLERLGECTRVLGKYEEARHYFERALEAREKYRCGARQLDEQEEIQTDALLWVETGKTYFDTGDFVEADRSYDQAEQLLDEAGVRTGPVRAILSLERSYILWRKGRFEEAREAAQQTLHIFDEVLQPAAAKGTPVLSTATRRTLAGDPVDLGRTHLLLGTIASAAGQSTDALVHLQTALAIFEQHDRQREIALVCGNIGDVYLRKSEHNLAQAALRRSLGIAERIGHASIMCVALGNLGMLATRLGDLKEAEAYYKQALQLAEQIHDPVYLSLWSCYLANALQAQRKLDEAKPFILNALKISRAKQITFCLGFALITLGYLRITQATSVYKSHSSDKKQKQKSLSSSLLLERARTSLLRGLELGGLEAETRTEGLLALSLASFLLGAIDDARQRALQAIDEAQCYEQPWLLAGGQRLMGSILSSQGQHALANDYFTRSLHILRSCGMRLEEARTLRSYGESLLERTGQQEQDGQADRRAEGLRYLQEARKIFEACHAALDLELVEQLLADGSVSFGVKL
jgi:predicted ATPase/DNA-binding SARP family transcriptional activator